MAKEDLTGKVFGRLTVLKEAEERSKKGYIQWICQCSCENKTIIVVPSNRLKSKKTQSCGCLQKETISKMNKERAQYSEEDRNNRLFRIWKGMLARTSYKSQKSYKDYGERGITVCDEWKNNFFIFKDWAFKNGYSDDLTIDRINNNGNYCPENCKWSTRKGQENNQRSNIIISFEGESHTAAQWAEIMGITKSCIYKRIQRKKPIEIVLKEFIERKN